MMIRKLLATALLAIAATGIASVTAHGEALVAGPTINGVDGPIAYTATVAGDRSSIAIDLASGTFALAPDASAVTVTAANGAVVGTIPTTVQMQTGQSFTVAPAINSDTSLTLTPVNAPAAAAAPEAIALQQIGDAGTTVAGVLIGCAIGFLIGLLFFFIGAPFGCVIGGIIGGITGANQ